MQKYDQSTGDYICGRILYLLDGRIQGELMLEDGYDEPIKKREEKVNEWLGKMGG